MAEVTLTHKGSWQAFNKEITRASVIFSCRDTYSTYQSVKKKYLKNQQYLANMD